MHRRQLSFIFTACMVLVAIIPATAGGKKGLDTPGERVGEHGSIDWDKGVLYATGLGAVSTDEGNDAKAYLRARSFARLDALRNLLMVVDHVRIDSSTVGKDFETVSDVIKAEVHGIVRGAQTVSERKIRIGNSSMIEVTVATPLYGDQGISQIFVPEIVRRNRDVERRSQEVPAPDITGPPDLPRIDIPRGQPEQPEIVAPLPREPRPQIGNPGDTFTSVIIDTRGLGIWRSMSPKIRRADGTEVWGTVTADPEFVIEHGIVVYAHSIEQARRLDRAGDNPLIIRAVGRIHAPFPSDPFISQEDADRLLAADGANGFLGRFRVIFVVDGDK